MLEWERCGGGGGGVEIEKGGDALRSWSLVPADNSALQAMTVGILTVAKAMEVV